MARSKIDGSMKALLDGSTPAADTAPAENEKKQPGRPARIDVRRRSVNFDRALWADLKIVAYLDGKTINGLLEEIAQAYVDKNRDLIDTLRRKVISK